MLNGTAPFNIGRLGGTTTTYHDGSTDEVVFYKRILTAGERTWLYNAKVTVSSLPSGVLTCTCARCKCRKDDSHLVADKQSIPTRPPLKEITSGEEKGMHPLP